MNKRKWVKMSMVAALMLVLSGCQSCDRSFGGTVEIELPPGTMLEDVEWNDSDIWYMYTDAPEDYEPRIHTMQESSNMGVMEGKVILKESKK